MMRARKTFAIGIGGTFLVLQLLVIQPIGGFEGAWYWPFANYPMYANANFAGDSVHVRQLRVVACAEDSARVYGFSDVNLWPEQFEGKLELVAHAFATDPDLRERARRAIGLLDRRLRRDLETALCRAEVWTKSAVLDRRLSDARAAEWRPVHRWTLGEPNDGGRSNQ